MGHLGIKGNIKAYLEMLTGTVYPVKLKQGYAALDTWSLWGADALVREGYSSWFLSPKLAI